MSTKTPPTKQQFADFLNSLPGATQYYGADKIAGWVNGSIVSENYDKMYAWYCAGNQQAIIAWVHIHTNQPQPQLKVTDVYAPIIAWLEARLQTANDQLSSVLEEIGGDDNPVAVAILQNEINTVTRDLTYYKNLESQIPGN